MPKRRLKSKHSNDKKGSNRGHRRRHSTSPDIRDESLEVLDECGISRSLNRSHHTRSPSSQRTRRKHYRGESLTLEATPIPELERPQPLTLNPITSQLNTPQSFTPNPTGSQLDIPQLPTSLSDNPSQDYSDDLKPSGPKGRVSESVEDLSNKRRKISSLDIPKIVWSKARDIFWCKIQTAEPFPDNVDDLAEKCFMEASDSNLEYSLSRVAIHTLADRQSAARGIFASSARDVVPQHYDCLTADPEARRIGVANLLDSETFRFHHADYEETTPKKMFLNKAISAVIAKAMYDSKRRNFARRPHTSKYTESITPQCLLLATVAVRHALENWVSGNYIRTTFEADTLKGVYEIYRTQWDTIPAMQQNKILGIHLTRIQKQSGLRATVKVSLAWDPETIIGSDDE